MADSEHFFTIQVQILVDEVGLDKTREIVLAMVDKSLGMADALRAFEVKPDIKRRRHLVLID